MLLKIETTDSLLFDDIKSIKALTNTSWHTVQRDEKNKLHLEVKKQLVIVPIYLGSVIYPEEIEANHLRVVFDNMQIRIFEEK